MDRRSQILAPTKKVGGVRRAHRAEPPTKDSLKATIEAMKNDTMPTILTTCSYRSDGSITSYESATVRSIVGKNRKHICFLVTGQPTTVSESEALSDMPGDVKSTLESIAETADAEPAKAGETETKEV